MNRCELCGAGMPVNQVPSHQQSKACERNRVEYEMRLRNLIPCSQVWSTLETAGLTLTRSRAPDKRMYAPAWAVYAAQSLKWGVVREVQLDGNYTAASRQRHRYIQELEKTTEDIREAVVATWMLGGQRAVMEFIINLGEVLGWPLELGE